MIKFFRKIRYDLMEKNKTGKYLKYAIGEIVLVVIGILIALQINNWNQEKHNRNYEITMLKEVKEALLLDLANLKRNSSFLKQVQHSLSEVTKMKNNDKTPRDSLYEHLDRIDSYGTSYRANRSPFEAIESGGLDKISNTEIRNALSKLYGFTLVNLQVWISEVHRHELFKRNELKEQIFEYNVVSGESQNIRNKLILNSAEETLKHPKFNTYLYTSGWPLPRTIQIMESTEENMKAMINLINQEINK